MRLQTRFVLKVIHEFVLSIGGRASDAGNC
jgi:hypothetical protein